MSRESGEGSTLVLGGSRFFGRRLVERLLERGDAVTILTRGAFDDRFGDRIERIRADRRDPNALADALQGRRFKVIFDQLGFQPRDAWGLIDAIGDRTSRIVFTSSGAVYWEASDASTSSPWRESAVNSVEFSQDELSRSENDLSYGRGKLACERLYGATEIPCAFLRIPVVIGPDDYTKRLDALVESAVSTGELRVDDATRELSLTTSADASSMLLQCSEDGSTGAVNVVSGRVPVTSLAEWISEESGLPVSVVESDDIDPFALSQSSCLEDSLARSRGWSPERPLEIIVRELVRSALGARTP